MTTDNSRLLKRLLDNHTPGTVVLSSWLKKLGISQDLQTFYRRSSWLESIGRGAFKRPSEIVTWEGGLYSIQTESSTNIAVGALTSLSMQGFSHYLRLEDEPIFLFSSSTKNLPVWFKNNNWGRTINHVKTDFLTGDDGYINLELKNFSIQISSPERAILECVYLTPNVLDITECYHLMEGLTNLRPHLLQDFLERCNSIKVKRLFLYMSEKADHQWFSFLKLDKVNLGIGARNLSPKGVFNAKYKITIPRSIEDL